MKANKYFTRFKKAIHKGVDDNMYFKCLVWFHPCHSIVLKLLVLPVKASFPDNLLCVNQGVTPIQFYRTRLLIDCQ